MNTTEDTIKGLESQGNTILMDHQEITMIALKVQKKKETSHLKVLQKKEKDLLEITMIALHRVKI